MSILATCANWLTCVLDQGSPKLYRESEINLLADDRPYERLKNAWR
jgi:hypothetical protein